MRKAILIRKENRLYKGIFAISRKPIKNTLVLVYNTGKQYNLSRRYEKQLEKLI